MFFETQLEEKKDKGKTNKQTSKGPKARGQQETKEKKRRSKARKDNNKQAPKINTNREQARRVQKRNKTS